MKKIIILLLTTLLISSSIFTIWKYFNVSTEAENATCIANPFEPCNDMTQAEKLTGFSMHLPDLPKGFSLLELSAVKDSMIQAIYENQDLDIYLRKSSGTMDISGDYNYYKNQNCLIIDNKDVTLKGNNDKIMVATWTQDGYTYAIDTTGISADIMLDLIQQIR